MNMKAYYEEAKEKIDAISTDLEGLKLQASLLKLEAKDEYESKMNVVNAKTAEARTHIEKLRSCSEDTYARIKDELEQTFRFVSNELEDVKNRCFNSN